MVLVIRPFDFRETGQRVVDEALRKVRDKFDELLRSPTAQAQVTPSFRVSSGTANQIAHGLQRAPVGWTEVYKSADVRVWDAKPPDGRYLYLGASGSATLKALVF